MARGRELVRRNVSKSRAASTRPGDAEEEQRAMTTFNRTTMIKAIALSLGIAAFAAGTPADAATHKRQHLTIRQQPLAVMPYGAHFGPDGVLYSSMGSAIPGYVLSQPNECWLEDGYSHWTTCNAD
jgi:hypothetical protein